MSEPAEIPVLAETLTAALLFFGAVITLIGAFGLVRLPTFYQRVHAPTLGMTLGAVCVALASMIYFSALGTRVVVHEVLIVIFVLFNTPITLLILVRAAVVRDRSEQSGLARSTERTER